LAAITVLEQFDQLQGK